jgi:predicted esterase
MRAFITLCVVTFATRASSEEFTCFSAGVTATKLADTPALIRVPRQITKPPILLWHGFGPPDSEAALMNALPLDDVPAVKVYLGLPMFGSRALPNGDLGRRQKQDLATLVFEPVIIKGAKELPAMVRALEQHGCMHPGAAVGLFGFSAGGAAALYALAEHDVRISAAVTFGVVAPSLAKADSWHTPCDHNPVFAPDASPHGLSYEDWAIRYLQWSLAFPATANPAADTAPPDTAQPRGGLVPARGDG